MRMMSLGRRANCSRRIPGGRDLRCGTSAHNRAASQCHAPAGLNETEQHARERGLSASAVANGSEVRQRTVKLTPSTAIKRSVCPASMEESLSRPTVLRRFPASRNAAASALGAAEFPSHESGTPKKPGKDAANRNFMECCTRIHEPE